MSNNAQGPVTGLTPHLQIGGSRGAEAVAFYAAAFGAVEQSRMVAEDGVRLMHAHLIINGASLMLHDEFPEYVAPEDADSGPPRGVALHLQVDDADAWFDRAVEAGALAKMALADQFWGDRYGQLADPFGHIWGIGAAIKG